MDSLDFSTEKCPPDVTQGVPVYLGTQTQSLASQMTEFTHFLEITTGHSFPNYKALHDYSVREYPTFWECFVRWSKGLAWSGSIAPVCLGDDCEHAEFFPHVQLNYADNLLGLSVAGSDAPALTACHWDGRRVHLTRGELRDKVARLAHGLSMLGVQAGDHVVGLLRNDEHAVVAALAVTALGATLSTASTEMGVETILDRFTPLAPRLLFAHVTPRVYDTGTPVADNVTALAAAMPSLQTIVRLDNGALPNTIAQPIYSLEQLCEESDASGCVWRRFPFNQPLFIMFSSGTTGKPKCIVHGAGGSLLEHLKEHRLHSDLRPGDKLFFHTSCAWMMWNWQLSALASGVEIVTFDGPISSADTLWRLVADEHVTVFGTSPAYLKMCQDAGLSPKQQFDLNALRAIQSTGSVLFDAQFDWVRDHVKALPLQSISGGTDILGCFVLGNPDLPVVVGMAQCKSLALDVQAWHEGVRCNGVGQLVCTNPFPSRPLGFFGDADGTRFHAAYFADNPGVWTHGDFIAFSEEGAARLHGRSDGLLNVRGVNVGPGEIYRILSDSPFVREAIVVQQQPSVGLASDSERCEARVVLLIVLQPGIVLSSTLAAQLRRNLAHRATPAHVPDRIIAVDALPVTHSGKLSESAVRDAVNGLPVRNAAALKNPECLDAIQNHPALHLGRRPLPPVGESREQLERHLLAQWENILAIAPIGREENFFDLGGHSLLAVRLLSEINRSTGRIIALSTLLNAPTVAGLTAAIDHSEESSSSSTLVQMRSGSGTPLFLAPSVSGSVMECWALIGALQTLRPVYGILAHGLDGEQPLQLRVEDMAASYIEQMRTVQPSGPYALAGYSFGGLIALEIAQQLRRSGEQIEFLCLIDTYVHERWLTWSARLRHLGRTVERHRRHLRTVPGSQIFPYLMGRVRNRFEIIPHNLDAFTAGLPQALRRVREAMWAAMKAYKTPPYDASIIVYLRAAIRQEEWGDPTMRLRHLGQVGLTIIEVPGNHNDMLSEPNVQEVAAVLDRALTGSFCCVHTNKYVFSGSRPVPLQLENPIQPMCETR